MAGLNRNIADAVVPLQLAWQWLVAEWPVRYPDRPMVILNEVFRTAATQRAYFAQGRQKLAIVNGLRRAAGLWPIDEVENRSKVTFKPPGNSRHERDPSEAFDIAFVKPNKTMDWSEENFNLAAQLIHEKYPDLIWGADWNNNGRSDDEKSVDRPHFQVA